MRMILFVCVLVCLVGSIVGQTAGTNCTDSNGNPDVTKCVGDAGFPYCMETNTDAVLGYNGQNRNSAPPSYTCVTCIADCDCKIGYYCQNDPNIQTNLYTCESYQSIIGQACSPLAQILNTGRAMTDNNLPHYSNLICGYYSSYLVTQTNITNYELTYKAQCVEGFCRECNGYNAYDGGCFQCEQRYCTGTASLGPVRYCVTGGSYWQEIGVQL